MSELGRLLHEARIAKEASLADVEAVTRIRQKYLEALEAGAYDRLPRGTVARGFLRTYATYLGLDAQAMLQQYIAESGDASEDTPIAEPGKPRLVDYRPLEVELMDEQPGTRWWPWIAALVIIIALGASGWWLLSRNPGWNPLQAFGPAPTITVSTTSKATRWVVTATPAPTLTPTAPLPQPTSGLLTLPTPTVPASPTPTPRPTATPEVVARISLELRTTQRSWLRVIVDGQPPEEGMLDANQSRTWEADQSISIRTGNAGGVILILNGEELGPMGAIGAVTERAWVVDQGQVTETTAETAFPTAPLPTPTPTPAG